MDGIYLLAITIYLLSVCGVASADEDRYLERKGFFMNLAGGGAFGAFDLDNGTGIYGTDSEGNTNSTTADFGITGDVHAGWAFTDRFGVSAGISSALFTYDRDSDGVLVNAGLGATAREFTFTMYDVSLWYWIPIETDTTKLFLRIGGGATEATEEAEGEEINSESGSGLLLGLGYESFVADRLAFTVETFFKNYGVSDKFMNGESSIATVGALFGVTYRTASVDVEPQEDVEFFQPVIAATPVAMSPEPPKPRVPLPVKAEKSTGEMVLSTSDALTTAATALPAWQGSYVVIRLKDGRDVQGGLALVSGLDLRVRMESGTWSGTLTDVERMTRY